jgi:hypothetical protein
MARAPGRPLGITPLRNQHVVIRRGDAALVLAGVDDHTGGKFGADHAPALRRRAGRARSGRRAGGAARAPAAAGRARGAAPASRCRSRDTPTAGRCGRGTSSSRCSRADGSPGGTAQGDDPALRVPRRRLLGPAGPRRRAAGDRAHRACERRGEGRARDGRASPRARGGPSTIDRRPRGGAVHARSSSTPPVMHGLSGLAVDADGTLWTVAERGRRGVRDHARRRARAPRCAIRSRACPTGEDLEAVAMAAWRTVGRHRGARARGGAGCSRWCGDGDAAGGDRRADRAAPRRGRRRDRRQPRRRGACAAVGRRGRRSRSRASGQDARGAVGAGGQRRSIAHAAPARASRAGVTLGDRQAVSARLLARRRDACARWRSSATSRSRGCSRFDARRRGDDDHADGGCSISAPVLRGTLNLEGLVAPARRTRGRGGRQPVPHDHRSRRAAACSRRRWRGERSVPRPLVAAHRDELARRPASRRRRRRCTPGRTRT